MRSRRFMLPVVAVLTLGAVLPADAGPKVLDGKKVKQVVSISEIPAATANVPNDPTDAQVLACKIKTECNRLDFVFKPAKGVKGDLTVMTKWYFPTTTDVDLYLVGAGKIVGRCASYLGNQRFIQVPGASLKAGKVYTAIAYYAHSSGETLTLQVDMPQVKVAQVTNENEFNHRVADCR